MTVRALEIALSLIDLFNNGLNEDEERLSITHLLESYGIKELKSFSFKNLKRFHQINLERKIPNNGVITPKNTLLSQEILFFLEYLEKHTTYNLSDRAVRDVSSDDCKW